MRILIILLIFITNFATYASDYMILPEVESKRMTGLAHVGASELHVLFFYDDEFAALHSDVDARLQSFVDWTNQAYQNSAMPITLVFAGSKLVDHDLVTLGFSVTDLLNRSNGFEIALDLQPLLQVQVLSFVSGKPVIEGLCGNGIIGSATPSISGAVHAFHDSCGSRTFAHELGHNLGSGHLAGDDCEFVAFSFACGHFNGEDRSIMNQLSSDQFYSNPLLNCISGPCGVPEGQLNAADNARAMPLVATELIARTLPQLTFDLPTYQLAQHAPLDVQINRQGWYGRNIRFNIVRVNTSEIALTRDIMYVDAFSMAPDTEIFDTSTLTPGNYRLDVFSVDRPNDIESAVVIIDTLLAPTASFVVGDFTSAPVSVDFVYTSAAPAELTIAFSPGFIGPLLATQTLPIGSNQTQTIQAYFLCGSPTANYELTIENPSGIRVIQGTQFNTPACIDYSVELNQVADLGVSLFVNPAGNFPFRLLANFFAQSGGPPIQVDFPIDPTASATPLMLDVEIPVDTAVDGETYTFTYILFVDGSVINGDFTQPFVAMSPLIFANGFE